MYYQMGYGINVTIPEQVLKAQASTLHAKVAQMPLVSTPVTMSSAAKYVPIAS